MPGAPLVSVIIPTRDRLPLLAAAIESVLRQGRSDVEVLVCDDGSDDETPGFARAVHETVRYIPVPRCGRPSVVRNRGLDEARGGIVAFLDDDDVWEPHKLTVQLAALDADAAAGFAYSDACLLLEDGSRSGPVLAGRPIGARPLLEQLIDDCFIHPSTVIVRRELLDRVGRFDEFLPIAEDYDLWLRLAAAAPGVFVPEPLVLVRRHAASHSTGNERTIYESTVRVLERQLMRRPQTAARRMRCRSALARMRARASACAAGEGDARSSRAHAVAAIRAHPLRRDGWRALLRSRGASPG